MSLYATKSPDGRYVTIGVSEDSAVAVLWSLHLPVTEIGWPRMQKVGWTCVPIRIIEEPEGEEE